MGCAFLDSRSQNKQTVRVIGLEEKEQMKTEESNPIQYIYLQDAVGLMIS